MMTDYLYTKDHPQANGREPLAGEHAYQFIFPLANGNSAVICCGVETLEKFREFLGSMQLDDALESPQPERSGDDGKRKID